MILLAWKMRFRTTLILGLSLLMFGCGSRDEVLRITSPDGKLDALVFETNCGAPCSFGYEVQLVARGSHSGEKVADFDGATRNDSAWGVNPKWLGPNTLSVEYLQAQSARLLKPTVAIASREVTVSLRHGVNDPLAPAGGMLYNLKGRH
jgi:hypothetical protein